MPLSLDGTTGISASGNITGGNVIASGALIVGSFSPASVSTAGNVTGGNVLTSGLISATGNITGGNILGGANVNATTHTGTTVNVTGNITGGNLLTGGLISATGNITGGNILGGANVNATTHTGTTVSVTGNITGGNILGGANVNATTHTGTTVSVTANITGGNILTAGLISATGSITTAGDISITGNIVDGAALSIITSSNGNITLAPNGTGVVVVNTDIRNGQASGTGNIGASGATFNTIFARATSAQYADLAELYEADKQLDAGHVVEFGGDKEIQKSSSSHSTQVAGIVSTNPSYLMNSALTAEFKTAVALTGRVPCYVVGTISKGDRLVASDIPGVATVLDVTKYQPGCIIGKSLEDYSSQVMGKIEVAVGRF